MVLILKVPKLIQSPAIEDSPYFKLERLLKKSGLLLFLLLSSGSYPDSYFGFPKKRTLFLNRSFHPRSQIFSLEGSVFFNVYSVCKFL